MTAQAWNITGLLCVGLGVILLFGFGMPYRTRTGGVQLLALQQRDEAARKQERVFDVLGWIGLVLVIAGTGCQIIANLTK